MTKSTKDLIEEKEKKVLDFCDSMEKFFSTTEFPKQIYLNVSALITDTKKFVEAHLMYIRSNKHELFCVPYVNRLILLKDIITKGEYGVVDVQPEKKAVKKEQAPVEKKKKVSKEEKGDKPKIKTTKIKERKVSNNDSVLF